jgi:N-acetylmuramoyl-L-alanine amidase
MMKSIFLAGWCNLNKSIILYGCNRLVKLNTKVMPIKIKRAFGKILVLTIFAFAGTAEILATTGIDPPDGIHTVVIDAGHGGRDPGAEGKLAKEKDIALAISLKLGKYIEENIPDVRVIYTRKTDVYPKLIERAQIANEAEADLFISIHVNASHKSQVQGTLTLVLGQHRADENFDVAVRENSVILLEEDYETTYEGFDPKSAESYIMFSLMQKTYFKQSIEFGSFVQDQFRERARRKDLGVREQGLLVLAQTSMPGVLVETGFISNPDEERYLMSEYGQDIIASAIYRGFKAYKEEIDRRSTMSVAREEAAADTGPSEVPTATTTLAPGQPVFRIQVASSRKLISTEPSDFKGHSNVSVVQDGRWYKYMLGNEAAYEEALRLCETLKGDFPDAFVVAVKSGKMMSLDAAINESKAYEN